MKQFSKELMTELDQVFQEDYGVKLSNSDLLETANALVGLFEIMAEVYKDHLHD